MTAAKRLHQLVAERVVGVALAAQAGAVERERAHGLDGARVEVPAVRRRTATTSRARRRVPSVSMHDRAAAGRRELERDRALRGSAKNVSAGVALACNSCSPAAKRPFVAQPATSVERGGSRSASSGTCAGELLNRRTVMRLAFLGVRTVGRADRRRLLGDVDRRPGTT